VQAAKETKVERAATLLLPNSAAKHDTGRHPTDGQGEIIKLKQASAELVMVD
jgi:hypothetical protein